VDRAFTEFGFPMGPCAMGDMAGLDVRVHYLQAMQDSGLIPDDPRYGVLTRALVAAGRLGQKSGAGNHDYGADGRTPVPSDIVRVLRDKLAAELGVAQRSFTDEEIVMRCLLPVINEAAKLLAEGIVSQASDIDVLWIYGYGFPAAKGGPVYLARQWGFEKVHAALRAQEAADARFGADYWAPSPALHQVFA
jgi:3-hydroxyacyl-CoA dehydrogenase